MINKLHYIAHRGLLVQVIIILGLFWMAPASSLVWAENQPDHSKTSTNSSAEPEQNKTWYTCGMHPEVFEDHPGNCPKCGMKLLPMSPDRAESLGLIKTADSDSKEQKERKILYWKSPMVPGEIHESSGQDSMGHNLVPVYEDHAAAAGAIVIDPVVSQNMAIRTALVKRGDVIKTVRSVGIVNYDETSLASVTTKVNGWIEKLYINKTGAQVHAGEKLFELYSPALFSAQEEYLAVLRSGKSVGEKTAFTKLRAGSRSMVADARTRLEYFDISDEQIKQIEETGKPKKTLTIMAPATGIVVHKNVVAGQMVKASEDLFRIADLSTVWVIVKIFESDLPYLKVGQPGLMSLSYLPGKTFRGYVTYIYPFLDEKTREVSVRMEFHNPGYELKPGMFANVQLSSHLMTNAVLVPDLAVIDTGLRKVAFTMNEPGHFQLKNVSIGARSKNNYLQVLGGLVPGEEVVISGQFMLDSESRLREAALKFLKPSQVSGPNPAEEVVKKTSKKELSIAESKIFYACPMPEHVDTLFEQPGKCPLCGMKLVPIPNQVTADQTTNSSKLEGHVHE